MLELKLPSEREQGSDAVPFLRRAVLAYNNAGGRVILLTTSSLCVGRPSRLNSPGEAIAPMSSGASTNGISTNESSTKPAI